MAHGKAKEALASASLYPSGPDRPQGWRRLPDGATGAALICYASGVDEAEAVRETVAILKQADTAPLDVTGYGTLAEREAQGHDIEPDERALMQRALDENAVIVAQMTPFFGDEAQA